MFVWLSYSQTLAAVIAGCEAAWEFFGGVFAVLIPDNLKPVIADADAVNPQFSQGWLDYAGHAGFLTDPARVASPKDKPRVERAVQYVRRNFWDGETFTDLEQAQLAAVALLTRSALTCSDCSRPSNLARWPTRRPNAPPWPASTNSAISGSSKRCWPTRSPDANPALRHYEPPKPDSTPPCGLTPGPHTRTYAMTAPCWGI